jgi:hypothetical protein
MGLIWGNKDFPNQTSENEPSKSKHGRSGWVIRVNPPPKFDSSPIPYEVVKSPIGRPDSDCYDVKLRFVDPENLQRSRTVKRFTIDVSDVMPVTIGQMRSWSEA